MRWAPANENEAYADLLTMHLQGFVGRLRMLPEDKWDWAPDVAAPTARTLAIHALQWLQCDRQHIAEPDAMRHEVIPEPPADPKAICDDLEAESARWRELILSLTPQQLAETRRQFNGEFEMNIRAFVCHMVQNTIYKHGQFSTLFFALGLDGTEPYDAPFPNRIYEGMRLKGERP